MSRIGKTLKRSTLLLASAAALVLGLAAARPADARVNFNIHILAGAPAFQVIPGTAVYYGDNYDCDVYRYSGQYYACEGDSWYRSGSCDRGFRPIAYGAVPRVVLQVSFGGH